MEDAYIGTIMPVALDFAPRGWIMCNGQLLSISQYTAVFSLLGTTFGGDGKVNFGVPDLRGRAVVGAGQGPGLHAVLRGQAWGQETSTGVLNGAANIQIPAAAMPSHTHAVRVDSAAFSAASTLHATASGPGATAPATNTMLGAGPATGPGSAQIYYTGSAAPEVAMAGGSVTTQLSGVANLTTSSEGGGQPFQAALSGSTTVNNTQPSLGLNYIMCVNGLFPPRN